MKIKEIIKKFEKKIIKILKIKYFEDISYEWLEYKKNKVKQSSYYNYKFEVEKYLNPYFGNKSIKKIYDISTFVDELSTNLAPKTIRDIFCVLKMILKYYEEEYNKKIKYKKIILPKLQKKEVEILTVREKNKLENYCIEQNTLKTLGIVISLNTGMRIGELCALKWKNINLTEKSIYIQNTVQRVYKGKNEKSKVIIDTPKTKCSVRVIPINTKLYNILKILSKKHKKEEFFLTGSETKCIEPRSYQSFFYKILTKAKLKRHNFHSTRHTFATNCIEIRNGYKDIKYYITVMLMFKLQ